jgi:hypothetical protein
LRAFQAFADFLVNLVPGPINSGVYRIIDADPAKSPVGFIDPCLPSRRKL